MASAPGGPGRTSEVNNSTCMQGSDNPIKQLSAEGSVSTVTPAIHLEFNVPAVVGEKAPHIFVALTNIKPKLSQKEGFT